MGIGDLWDPVFGPGENAFEDVVSAFYRGLARRWEQEAHEIARWEDDGGCVPCRTSGN